MKLRNKLVIGAALAFAATSVAWAAQAPAPAEIVFVNCKVFTADAHDRVFQGFAITGDRFVAIGTNAAVRRYVGARTRVIDLKGRFVSPGLTDDHFHNEGGGSGVDLSHVRTLGELLMTIANAAAAAPPGTVIVSNSDWHEAQLREQRLPTAEELDQAAGDKTGSPGARRA
jgi:predicted amidohydrolase YtcJ